MHEYVCMHVWAPLWVSPCVGVCVCVKCSVTQMHVKQNKSFIFCELRNKTHIKIVPYN